MEKHFTCKPSVTSNISRECSKYSCGHRLCKFQVNKMLNPMSTQFLMVELTYTFNQRVQSRSPSFFIHSNAPICPGPLPSSKCSHLPRSAGVIQMLPHKVVSTLVLLSTDQFRQQEERPDFYQPCFILRKRVAFSGKSDQCVVAPLLFTGWVGSWTRLNAH